MTKGEKLIWELFMWLREIMPPTPENTKRQQEWAAVFHAMEHHDVVTGPDEAAADHDVDAPELEHDDDEPPVRSPGKRKKK